MKKLSLIILLAGYLGFVYADCNADFSVLQQELINNSTFAVSGGWSSSQLGYIMSDQNGICSTDDTNLGCSGQSPNIYCNYGTLTCADSQELNANQF